jgi:hypothetical protein
MIMEVANYPLNGAVGVNGPTYVLFRRDQPLSLQFGGNYYNGVGFYLTDFLDGCNSIVLNVKLYSGNTYLQGGGWTAPPQQDGVKAYIGVEYPTPFNRVDIQAICPGSVGKMGLDEVTVLVGL